MKFQNVRNKKDPKNFQKRKKQIICKGLTIRTADFSIATLGAITEDNGFLDNVKIIPNLEVHA